MASLPQDTSPARHNQTGGIEQAEGAGLGDHPARLTDEALRLYRLVVSLHPGAEFAAGVVAAAAGFTDIGEADRLLADLVAAEKVQRIAPDRYSCADHRRHAAQSESLHLDPAPVRTEVLLRILAWYHDTALKAAELASSQHGQAPTAESDADRTAALAWLAVEESNLRIVANLTSEIGRDSLASEIIHALSQLGQHRQHHPSMVPTPHTQPDTGEGR